MIESNSKYKLLYQNLPDVRYYIITGGRGSGKSFEVGTFASLLTLERNQRILFTRYTLVSAGISIIPEFVDKIERLELLDRFHITKDGITNLLTGSDVIFKGIKTSSGDQTANLKSLQGVTCWILDEAEELTDEDTFDKINLSIRESKAKNRVILIMNPSTKEHWVYKRFFEEKGVEPGFIGVKDDAAYIHTTYLDNIDNLSETFIRDAENMKRNKPNKYKHVMEGGWLDRAEGVIFSDWSIGEFDTSLPYIFGQDFGYSVDPTTLVKIAVDDKKQVVYVDELIYKAGMNTVDTYNEVALYALPTDLVIADSAEPRLIDELKHRGLNIKATVKGADSVRAGIKRLQDYKIVVTPSSTNIVKELNNYVWHDKKSDTPIDGYNHTIDAIRYAFMYLKDNPNRGTYRIV